MFYLSIENLRTRKELSVVSCFWVLISFPLHRVFVVVISVVLQLFYVFVNFDITERGRNLQLKNGETTISTSCDFERNIHLFNHLKNIYLIPTKYLASFKFTDKTVKKPDKTLTLINFVIFVEEASNKQMTKQNYSISEVLNTMEKEKEEKGGRLKQGLLILVENLGFIGLRNHWGGSVLS